MDFSQSVTIEGLRTITFIAPSNGNYKIEGKLSLPLPSQGGGETAVVVVINLNGSPVYTGVAGAEGFKRIQPLLTSDTVTIVLSSSASADQPKNAVKTTLSISAGE